MLPEAPGAITELLQRWAVGERDALRDLMPLVYNDLRAIARARMRAKPEQRTLQPTALVHELYLRLLGQHTVGCDDRHHFFSFAAMMMRRILVDDARRRGSERRGAGAERVPLSEELPWIGSSAEEIVAFDEALAGLGRFDPRKARILELRGLLGCGAGEAAEILGISKATADRDWTMAKAWIHRELTRGGGGRA